MFTSPFNFNLLDGNNGFVVRGIDEADNLGSSVSGGGDLNGDGLDDIAIATSGATSEGETYVVFGRNENFTTEYDLTTLDGNNGFVIRGIETTDKSFIRNIPDISLSITGDFNGDGFDDLIVGAPGAGEAIIKRKFYDEYENYYSIREDNYIRGKSYVIFGKDEGFAAELDVTSLDGSNGFTLLGSHEDGEFGTSVSNAGDVNGDGFDDIIVGAPYAGDAFYAGDIRYRESFRDSATGESYVVFGSGNGFTAEIDVASLDGSNGFTLRGSDSYHDRLGSSVGSAGDVNGDGIDDLILEVPGFASYSSAKSYIIAGSRDGFAAELDLTTLKDSDGFVNDFGYIYRFSSSTNGAGDINGDGFDDLIIGSLSNSWREDPILKASGEILFGNDESFTANRDLNSLSINGIDGGNYPDIKVSSVGDVNGDGFDDLIISASGAGEAEEYINYNDRDYAIGDKRGKNYVIFGNNEDFGSDFDVTNLDGSNGFVLGGIDEDDRSGTSVSSAGDLNGDGVDDIIIGAPNAESYYSEQGEAYVVFGSNSSEQNDNRIAISDATSEEGNEGNTEFVFTVFLEEASQETISVNFNTEDNIAIAGEDYIATEGTLEFAPGETEKTVAVEVTGNADLEENETFFLNLSNANGAAIADNRGIATITNDDIISSENIIELFCFRNITFETDTYIFVGEAERDTILNNRDYNQTFAEVEDYTFMASSVPRDDLLPFYRLRSLDVPGTYLFVSTEEYDAIFADDSEQQDKWVKEGLNNESEDIPDFYLLGDSADRGNEFHRFHNRQHGTFLYADLAETEAIINDEDLSSLWIHQGVAFESI